MNYLRLLQLRRGCFFNADSGGGTGGSGTPGDTAPTGEQGNTDGGEGDNKPPSFDDVLKDKGHQSEFDRRVAKALETAKSKWDQEAQQKLEAAKTEAEKMAKMTADQRAEHEKQQHEAKLLAREAEITKRELRAQALETLAEKDLPKELIETISLTDADSCTKSLEVVEKAFRAAVQKGVDERLKGSAPKAGGNSITEEELINGAFEMA